MRDPIETTEVSIREYLIGRLATFKVPAHLLIVDNIPKSSTGKIEGATQAERFAARLQGVSIAPKNKLEALVASIYADVLEIQDIGTEKNSGENRRYNEAKK